MTTYLVLDEDNYVTNRRSSSTPPDGYIADDVDWDSRPSEYHSFNYVSKTWVDRRAAGQAWSDIRQNRNARLRETDWTQLPDVPAPTRAMWQPYRQALRDITNQPNPFTIVWPQIPE